MGRKSNEHLHDRGTNGLLSDLGKRSDPGSGPGRSRPGVPPQNPEIRVHTRGKPVRPSTAAGTFNSGAARAGHGSTRVGPYRA